MEFSDSSQIGVGESKQPSLSVRHKEKRRTESLNKAFGDLRQCIPHVPKDTKLSKIKTLQLASNYISHLSKVLENPTTSDQNEIQNFDFTFKPCLSRPRKSNSNFQSIKRILSPNVSRFHQTSYNSGSSKRSKVKRSKGRTGWPEAVWVEALASGSKANEAATSISVEENLDLSPFASHCGMVPFQAETSEIPNGLTNNPEHMFEAVPYNQNYFHQKDSIPLFMLNNQTECGYFKSSFPCTDQVMPATDYHSNPLLNHDFSSHSVGSMSGCSTPPDLIHASAISLPLAPAVEPLPSITTLRLPDRDRYQSENFAQILNSDVGVIDSDFIEYDFQNGLSDEPSFVELQPVSRFNRQCAEMV